jgi:hypothetical protein
MAQARGRLQPMMVNSWDVTTTLRRAYHSLSSGELLTRDRCVLPLVNFFDKLGSYRLDMADMLTLSAAVGFIAAVILLVLWMR